MWLEATFTVEDLSLVLDRLCPAHIELDERRWVGDLDLRDASAIKMGATFGVEVSRKPYADLG